MYNQTDLIGIINSEKSTIERQAYIFGQKHFTEPMFSPLQLNCKKTHYFAKHTFL